jgi:light-regulated signal transduction histidine kinase (bacteriophytochrome)
MVAVNRDRTEWWKTEEKVKVLNDSLRERAAQLEAANKGLESFAYSVSHDLRAPLRSIDGFSLALLEDYASKLDDQGKDCLHRVRAASQVMGQLIDDMLELSRVSRTELRWKKIDLSALVQDISQQLQYREPKRSVDLTIASGLSVHGDAVLLRAALENLLNNAWKFTGRCDRPKVEFGAMKEEGQQVYFVKDNGVGFDMNYAGKLFEPFQRLHSKDEFSGTGVGLATVRRIIDRHGGRIWAKSKVGDGATFYFTLGERPER